MGSKLISILVTATIAVGAVAALNRTAFGKRILGL